MARHDLIPLEAASEWREGLRGIPHAFAHTQESCQAMALTTGHRTFLYRFESHEGVRVVCPLAERTGGGATDLVTPYGLSGFAGTGDCPELPALWSELAKRRGHVCGYIALHPVFQNPSHFDLRDVYTYNHIYVLDLGRNEEELFAGLSENRRREVRRSESEGLELVLDREALLGFFLAHWDEFFRQRDASPVYRFAPETLARLFSLENSFAVGVGRDGRLEAVSLFAWTTHAGEFLFNVSRPEGRRHSAALLWQGARHLKRLGVPLLNLGGGIRDGDGVALFKERFGGRKLPLSCLRQVYDRDAYERLCRRAGADPDSRAGYFPPYRDPRRAAPERGTVFA